MEGLIMGLQDGRIGFCCKAVRQGAKGMEPMPGTDVRSTTVAWLKRQTKAAAEQRLWDIMEHNMASTRNLVEMVGSLDPSLRMVRIGSDLLPVYTEPSFCYYWRDPVVRGTAAKGFAAIGELARRLDVRLSFHPGQFCVLASESDDIVTRSIEEFEYHVDMARWMGYGATWHDHGFKINVHISGRRGPEGIRAALGRMTPEARNLITIENEENVYGIDDCLSIGDGVAIVLDVHHHWVREGSYISPMDDRVRMVEDSWRGVRPTLHYSVSREDLLGSHASDQLPDMGALLAAGHKKQKLRAHSDFYWNAAANDYVLGFADRFDIQCESKAKNLASLALHAYHRSKPSKTT